MNRLRLPSRLKKNLVERSNRWCCCSLNNEDTAMKLTTIALATTFTLASTFAMAQTPGLSGYGSVVAPSVGSYQAPVGSTNQAPTWSSTGPAASLPSSPTVGSAFGSNFTPLVSPRRSTVARAGHSR